MFEETLYQKARDGERGVHHQSAVEAQRAPARSWWACAPWLHSSHTLPCMAMPLALPWTRPSMCSPFFFFLLPQAPSLWTS